MFIYHFSRLIKSKLLWGFLILLMVFAFVVVDSCVAASGQSDGVAGYLGDTPISRTDLADASQVVTILEGQTLYYLPQRSQIFAAMLRSDARDREDWQARRRQNWKLIAAREVALKNGMEMSVAGGNNVLETMFAGQTGVFDPNQYRNFLAMNQYTKPQLFEKTFANAWLPAQSVAVGVFNAVGWISPMEQDFATATAYDVTTAYAASLKDAVALDSITVSDDEAKAWYDAHQDDYQLPEQRAISYVEVPSAPFAEKLVIDDMDAMQYYDDNNDEFKGTGTNENVVLPFEEVKDKAVEKVKARRALEDALTYANETLVAAAQTASITEVAKAYGEAKQTTVRMDRPFGFQNARDVIAAAFEMDPETTPYNAVAGTDRIYLVQLTAIIPEGIEAFDAVKTRVIADVRRDRQQKALEEKGAALREKLAAELAKGSAFDAAVAACQVEGLTATTGMTFVLNDSSKAEIPYRNEVLGAVAELGTKALSEAIVTPSKEIVLVYVADRQPGDALAKTTGKSQLATSLGWPTQFRVASMWMDWILDTLPPTVDGKTPVLDEEVAEDPEE